MADMREDKIVQVIEGMNWLILHNANCTAREQYCPMMSPDESDNYIREHKEFVGELRRMRQEFENLVTGMI